MDSSRFPIFPSLCLVWPLSSWTTHPSAGSPPNKKRGRRVMLLKLRRITAVLTAALTLAAASIPTNAEAQGFYGPADGWGRGAWGDGGGWDNAGWDNAG